MTISCLNDLLLFFKDHDYSSYDRVNFDKFLKDKKVSFPLKTIHITGTNGKGSTANYLQHIYSSAGYKVGEYNSPFFYSPYEMISLDGVQISEKEYLILFNEFVDDFEKYHLSSFEIQTIIAYEYFKRNSVDIAIIEVGMGGLTDATNILATPLAAVITTVSLEHCSFLGKTTSEIAQNKAGIINGKCKVIVGTLDDDAKEVVRKVAKRMDCDFIETFEAQNIAYENGKLTFDYKNYQRLTLATPASYQAKNAIVAIEVVESLNSIFNISRKQIENGLMIEPLICRFELIDENILIDGAHNPEAIENLFSSLASYLSKKIRCVFACFKDKNLDSMLAIADRECESVLLTTFNHKRARTEEDYFLYLADYDFEEDYKKAIDDTRTKYPDDLIVVCGSLAFASVARKYLVEKKHE